MAEEIRQSADDYIYRFVKKIADREDTTALLCLCAKIFSLGFLSGRSHECQNTDIQTMQEWFLEFMGHTDFLTKPEQSDKKPFKRP